MSIPLWPVAGIGALLFDIRGVILISALALAATLAAIELHRQDRVDERISQGIAEHRRSEAQIARIAGAAMEGGQLAAAPIRRASGGLPVLRSVPDAS